MAALAAGAVAVGAVGCGGHRPRPAALRLERADLVLLARDLQRLEAPIGGEVGAARVVWPAIAHGLPARLSPAVRLQLVAARQRAEALTLPSYLTTEGGGLTGPAVSVGGLLESYFTLTRHGWRYLAAVPATAAGVGGRGGGAGDRGKEIGPAGARFLRANSGLYIHSVYDGHYDLSLIGKALVGAYQKLGGAPAFGGSLTQGRVEGIARAYSIPAGRLTPQPPPGLGV